MRLQTKKVKFSIGQWKDVGEITRSNDRDNAHHSPGTRQNRDVAQRPMEKSISASAEDLKEGTQENRKGPSEHSKQGRRV